MIIGRVKKNLLRMKYVTYLLWRDVKISFFKNLKGMSCKYGVLPRSWIKSVRIDYVCLALSISLYIVGSSLLSIL
jgi:hypothetical protein